MRGDQQEQVQRSKDMIRHKPAPLEQRAIDQWVRDALQNHYAQVAQEPIPEELLALVRHLHHS
ncbi:hypothetical protein HMPREF9946_01291 [Acetobacteraceae bacterium AT-5844]|nr:hypothetical protein HMPREF9946_01291 [Acetobacteraceae bacterium AT-5844]